MHITLLYLSLILLFSGCKKYEEVVISGNTPPPDKTIPASLKESYINKVFISILGRKPAAGEFQQCMLIAGKNNFSGADRREILDTVFMKPEYREHLYSIARIDLLNDQDTNEIAQMIAVFQVLLQDSSYFVIWDLLGNEITRLNDLRAVPAGLKDGTIDEKELYGRCVNNYFYDQINMGTANFVVSMWQHFLYRYPTDAELQSASRMVDGFNASVFFQAGVGKKDFLSIFFASADYLEGQVRDLYSRYLFRLPGSTEISECTALYKSSGSYEGLQKKILSSDEYAGIK